MEGGLPPPLDQLPFGLFRVACDEVTVHVEETDPQQVEDYVQSVPQRHRLVVSLPEGSQGFLLRTHQADQTGHSDEPFLHHWC